jgi:hypothetical protein
MDIVEEGLWPHEMSLSPVLHEAREAGLLELASEFQYRETPEVSHSSITHLPYPFVSCPEYSAAIGQEDLEELCARVAAIQIDGRHSVSGLQSGAVATVEVTPNVNNTLRARPQTQFEPAVESTRTPARTQPALTGHPHLSTTGRFGSRASLLSGAESVEVTRPQVPRLIQLGTSSRHNIPATVIQEEVAINSTGRQPFTAFATDDTGIPPWELAKRRADAEIAAAQASLQQEQIANPDFWARQTMVQTQGV